jgi:pyruvate-formate lyase-activating enzyme
MRKIKTFLTKLMACIEERRMPWSLMGLFYRTKQKYFPISILHYFKRFSSEKDVLVIEISSCNLKCAMCARSAVLDLKEKRGGMMDLDLFKKVIDKVVTEKFKFRDLMFGNWGEPLLNPLFQNMVKYAKSKLPNTIVSTFTNLTCLKDPKAIISSGLDRMWISVSGMTQEVYSKNHIGGDINIVLNNLKELIHYKKQLNSNIKLIMRFHEYAYNKGDSVIAKKFCDDTGIEFEQHWCYIPCAEANIKYHQNKQELGRFYGQFIDMKQEDSLMRKLDDYRDCAWLNESVVINYDSRLYRCCGVYEDQYLLGSFFDYKIRDIQNIKSKICKLCAETPISLRLSFRNYH